jgi:hypothetical protein
VYIPQEAYAGCGIVWPQACHVISLLEYAKLCENNVYETNMIPTTCSSDGSNDRHFVLVRNEVFTSGTAFRHNIYSEGHDVRRTSIPYSEGLTSIGDRIVLRQHDDSNNNRKMAFGTSAPLLMSEFWNTGDIRYNAFPKPGDPKLDYVGWVCTNAGWAVKPYFTNLGSLCSHKFGIGE